MIKCFIRVNDKIPMSIRAIDVSRDVEYKRDSEITLTGIYRFINDTNLEIEIEHDQWCYVERDDCKWYHYLIGTSNVWKKIRVKQFYDERRFTFIDEYQCRSI